MASSSVGNEPNTTSISCDDEDCQICAFKWRTLPCTCDGELCLESHLILLLSAEGLILRGNLLILLHNQLGAWSVDSIFRSYFHWNRSF